MQHHRRRIFIQKLTPVAGESSKLRSVVGMEVAAFDGSLASGWRCEITYKGCPPRTALIDFSRFDSFGLTDPRYAVHVSPLVIPLQSFAAIAKWSSWG